MATKLSVDIKSVNCNRSVIFIHKFDNTNQIFKAERDTEITYFPKSLLHNLTIQGIHFCVILPIKHSQRMSPIN